MTTEVIWKELSCPMTGGDLCTRSACMGAICGISAKKWFFDKEEEITKEYTGYKTEWEGWWIFGKHVTVEETREQTYIKRHFCKELKYSYITCMHHHNNNIGIKITVSDIDEERTKLDSDGWQGYYDGQDFYEHPVKEFESEMEKVRSSIERDCVYDSLD